MKYVGQSVRSLDADEKVTGTAVYTADLTIPGMKFARVIGSPHAHARIDGFHLEDALAVPGVRTIVTHDSLDFSRLGCLRTLKPYGQAVKDRPVLAHGKVRFQGEPVAIVVADSETAAVEAAARVEVRYTPLPQVSEMMSAMEGGTLVHDADSAYDREGESDFDHDYGRNNCGGTHFVQGDPERAFREAAHVIEDHFSFPSLFHYPMEPHCAVATVDDKSVTVHTSSQAPFPVRDELARMFGLEQEQVTVKVPYVGGGFGAKGHIGVEHLAILAAAASGETVQLRMSMEETAFTARRHPAEIEIRTGLREDGTLLCREARIYLDTGAYADFGIQVTRKAAFRSVGPYRVAHARADCYSVYTNKVPAGAFRGIGSVQLGWACEAHTDHICTELGYDPIEFRLKNLLRAGEKYVLGGPPLDGNPHDALTACMELFEKTRQARTPESLARPGEKIGTGVACAIKDLSTTQYNARIVFEDDATFTVHANAPEIGGGAMTVLAQTAAEALGVGIERITIAPYDTSTTPGASGVYGSRITVLMGNAVKRASEELRELMLQQAAALTDRDVQDLSLDDGVFSGDGDPVMTLDELADRITGTLVGRGMDKALTRDRIDIRTWEINAGIAVMAVDSETGRARCLTYVSSADIGQAMHPLRCEGQEQGSIMFGMGNTLTEEQVFDGALLLNPSAIDYALPRFKNLPAVLDSVLIENRDGPGPFGSKGMAEGGLAPVAPAIAAALREAVGIVVHDLPMSPERVYRLMESGG